MRKLALQSELPRHTVSRTCLQYPISWHTFESSPSSDGNVNGVQAPMLDAMLLFDAAGTGIGAVSFGASETTRDPFVWFHGTIPYGASYPLDEDGASNVLKMLAFLNSKFVITPIELLSRPTRRAMERRGDIPAPNVSVVRLRAAETYAYDETGAGSVDWAHRWMVRGHYRAQWYPSEAAHHVVWIAPYLKGPEDKPLLTHVYAVVR